MTNDYPIQLDVVSPPHFDRVQLLLRLLLAIALACFGITAGWLGWTLYALLPLIAAIAISTEGADAYVSRVGPAIWRVLRWLLELNAYVMLVTDRFPTAEGSSVKIELRATAKPTVGTALWRLVTSLPSGLVLCLLGVVSSILCVFAVVLVLFGAAMPAWILAYQRGMLRWEARLAAYHACLVEEYPPFSFDTGAATPPAMVGAQHT
ncbi:MAG: DUF4389 domain-containing protein [Deltaproteobacteria bacterium]|nr:DUF4389 domain-containing protein [Deltaproteobacteria bacterium]